MSVPWYLMAKGKGGGYKTVSGPIVSVNDALAAPLRSLVANIEPVQDLHGYDAPWPAGGGKNLFNYENTGITFANMGQSGSVFSNTNTDSRTFFNFQFRALNNGTVVVTSDAQSISSTGRKSATITISETITHVSIVHNGSQRNLSVTYPFTGQGTFTISFNVTAFNPSSVGGLSFKDVQLEAGSTATSFAPYSNICPISGWSEVNVWRTGKNLLNPNFADYSMSATYRFINGVVPKGQTARFVFTDKDTSVDLGNTTAIGFCFEDLSDAIGATEYRWAISGGVIQSNTSNVSAHGVVCSNVFIYPRTSDTFDKIFSRYNVMVELGSTAAPYEPYSGNQYTIQLGQTVYGGTLDVTNGVLTVDREMVDLGTLNWQYVSDDVFFTSGLYGLKKPGIHNYINSTYGFSAASFADMPDKTMKGNMIAGGIYVKDSAFGQNPATAKTGLFGVQLVYELATPLTIPLTPQEISTLQGANNLWADTGDVTVEYLSRGGANPDLMKLAVAFMGRK